MGHMKNFLGFSTAPASQIFLTNCPCAQVSLTDMKSSTWFFVVVEELDCYPVTSTPPGYCVIVNNESFDKNETRSGSWPDVQKIQQIFGNTLKFDVIIEKDQTKDGLLSLFERISQDDKLYHHDILVMFVMSHGIEDHVRTVDEFNVHYDHLISFFNQDKCPALHNKPKIFVFNCCRLTENKDKGLLPQVLNSLVELVSFVEKEKCVAYDEKQSSPVNIMKVFSTLNSE